MLPAHPQEELQFCGDGGFAWHPRYPNLRKHTLPMGQNAVNAVYEDASGVRCWGAVLRDQFIQGKWPKSEMRVGINWREF